MGGPSSDSGSSDGPNTTRSTVTKVRKKNPIVDFIKGGGIPGAIIRTVKKGIENNKAKAKDRKINDSYLGSSDYQGDVSKRKTPTPTYEGGGNDNNSILSNNIEGPRKVKSIEQPKVKSQMNNSGIKSGLIVADKIAPTEVEMTAEEKLVARKRGRKTKTVLTSVTGDNTKATLSKKTLLG